MYFCLCFAAASIDCQSLKDPDEASVWNQLLYCVALANKVTRNLVGGCVFTEFSGCSAHRYDGCSV